MSKNLKFKINIWLYYDINLLYKTIALEILMLYNIKPYLTFPFFLFLFFIQKK